MPKARSPSYPAIGLREAIEKVRLVYDKDYQNKIPRPLVAEHMGYRSLNGKSLGVLAAVAKYGLMEGRGEANWITDLALQIIAHAPGSPERSAALMQAAQHPELFADLDARFNNGKVSDGAIRSYLMTQKFIPLAADAAVKSYRETKQLVSEETGGYTPASAPEPETESAPVQPIVATSGIPLRGVAVMSPPQAAPSLVSGESEMLRGRLRDGSGWRLLVSGNVGAKELGAIIRMLAAQQKELLVEDGTPEAGAESIDPLS